MVLLAFLFVSLYLSVLFLNPLNSLIFEANALPPRKTVLNKNWNTLPFTSSFEGSFNEWNYLMDSDYYYSTRILSPSINEQAMGQYSLHAVGSNLWQSASLGLNFSSPSSTFWFTFAVLLKNLPTSGLRNTIFSLNDTSGKPILDIFLNNAGGTTQQINFEYILPSGSGGNIINIWFPNLNQWYWFNIFFSKDLITGSYILYLDGQQIASWTFQNTFGFSNVGLVRFGVIGGSWAMDAYFDYFNVNIAGIPSLDTSLQWAEATNSIPFADRNVIFNNQWYTSLINGYPINYSIFEIYNGAMYGWGNGTALPFGTTRSWDNRSVLLTSDEGDDVRYRWYANNSIGEWSVTPLFNVTTCHWYDTPQFDRVASQHWRPLDNASFIAELWSNSGLDGYIFYDSFTSANTSYVNFANGNNRTVINYLVLPNAPYLNITYVFYANSSTNNWNSTSNVLMVRPSFSWLRTFNGTLIDTRTNQTVRLTGVNFRSFEDAKDGYWVDNHGVVYTTFNTTAMQQMVNSIIGYGFNAIRIPFNVYCWQQYTSTRNAMDSLIAYAKVKNITVILAPWNLGFNVTTQLGNGMRTVPYPDPLNPQFDILDRKVANNTNDWVTFWGNFSKHMWDYPNVVFDLLNEPHDDYSTSPAQGLAFRDAYFRVCQLALDDIREWHDAVVMVQWGYACAYEINFNTIYTSPLQAFLSSAFPTGDDLAISTHMYETSFGYRYNAYTGQSNWASTMQDVSLAFRREGIQNVTLLGIPLIVGEIGCNMLVQKAVELNAVENALKLMQGYGTSWLAWWYYPALTYPLISIGNNYPLTDGGRLFSRYSVGKIVPPAQQFILPFTLNQILGLVGLIMLPLSIVVASKEIKEKEYKRGLIYGVLLFSIGLTFVIGVLGI